ncbi:conserved Plasmodium protein, unknown function [Plasmodium knowlesi strain H]|uniref:Uncharacterized protein n=3 Tax=Plasmodium knowlesi TaxID=5850 RepID=A0A5K1TXL9_PLAKH|nr:conserved Plasmodium protein, unknown function [Plasmodium knowlesi strain H]OTN68760.1 Uncharacterized protein PKNOH_S01018300 [Plasmodium knowlesi]CAA9986180.1 conserved Plasmodium protein, unknown function [Plasmodium knowlesi strain H]SBO25379.1 conserved Plasmodium protein, unknown function [Plasmodium knowlesi strain H]SBO27674.1 conserved Plasmodium protein, unknown function [Plasmodium knowlesi strain H]VVS75654.1 conserved Plasmodium protein, unknown function [Plasmodium knowlesi s|eukprot:XP_002257591.1 hypothetical protein, conserved in Plasmodium species [Plasmodium knowlesi strain H]
MNPSSNEKKRNLPPYADDNGYDMPPAGAPASVMPTNVMPNNVMSNNVLPTNMVQANVSSPPAMTMHNPYFYPGAIIPQYPFNTPMYQQPMSYGHMMPYGDYGYGNKRFGKRKKNYHNYSRQQNSGVSILKEAIVDPWAQQYAKYPNIIFD